VRTPKIIKILCSVLILCLLSAAIPTWAGELGVVTENIVNIRSGPGTNYKILTKVYKGESYTVLGKSDKWVKIKLNNGQEGWICGDYFNVFAVADKKVVTNYNKINLRQGPGTGYARVGMVDQGIVLTVLQSENGWYKVITPTGGQAWIAGWLVTEQTTPAPGSNPEPEPNPNPGPGTGNENGNIIDSQYPQVMVTGSVVNIRAAGNLNAQVLDKVPQGTILPVLNKSGDWYYVQLNNGVKGWIASWYTTAASSGTSSGTVPSRSGTSEVLSAPLSAGRTFRILESSGRLVLVLEGWGQGQYETAVDKSGKQVTLRLDGTTTINYDGKLNRLGIENIRIGTQGDKSLITLLCSFVPALSTDTEGNTTYLNLGVDTNQGLGGRLIVIDPGHSGVGVSGSLDPGAIGPRTGLHERVVTLDIANKLKILLESAGARVIMTHTYSTALSLAGRAEIANQNRADIFVSIHANSTNNRNTAGHTTYYYAPASDPVLGSQRYNRMRLASLVQQGMVQVAGRANLGIKESNYAVLRETRVPSILVETAYLSNPEEELLLGQDSFRQKLAEGIFRGIVAYFN